MGRWTDIAEWRGPTANHGGPMLEQRGLVEHIAEGSYEGTISWCKNPSSGVSAHFVVAKDGRIAQVLDTDIIAWTQRDGNGHWLSVENEGHTPGALTPAQVDANARIFAKTHNVYGVPLQLATSPAGRGLGHHSMGAESGANWGHSACPGPAIKAQKPAILARAIAIVAGATGGDEEMPKFLRVVDSTPIPGAIVVTTGAHRYGIATVPDMNAALTLWGLTAKDLIPVKAANLNGYGELTNAHLVTVTLSDAQLAELVDAVPTTEEIGAVVDRELDEQSRAGADAD